MPEHYATLTDPTPDDIPATPLEFLARLGGPTEIRVRGRDRSRARAVSALLHGNEPSSLVAVHRWLRTGYQPAVDTSIFVSAVEAALAPPGFAQRMLPGRRDLNRCFFGPFDDPDGRLARDLLGRLRARPYEALVDLHNNTGRNPAYGIIQRRDLALFRLIEMFTHNCCVLSDLHIGALTEVMVDELPSVAIECGHSADPGAHDVAFAGLETFLGEPDLGLRGALENPVLLLDHPIRVELRRGISVTFSETPSAHAELTLRPDVDVHNFRRLDRGTVLGWVHPDAPWPLVARGADGVDVSARLFAVRDGALVHESDLVPIMMTTNAQIALVDCLCYLMSRHDWSRG